MNYKRICIDRIAIQGVCETTRCFRGGDDKDINETLWTIGNNHVLKSNRYNINGDNAKLYYKVREMLFDLDINN